MTSIIYQNFSIFEVPYEKAEKVKAAIETALREGLGITREIDIVGKKAIDDSVTIMVSTRADITVKMLHVIAEAIRKIGLTVGVNNNERRARFEISD